MARAAQLTKLTGIWQQGRRFGVLCGTGAGWGPRRSELESDSDKMDFGGSGRQVGIQICS